MYMTLLASFFLPSHLSFKNLHIVHCCSDNYIYIHVVRKELDSHELISIYGRLPIQQQNFGAIFSKASKEVSANNSHPSTTCACTYICTDMVLV